MTLLDVDWGEGWEIEEVAAYGRVPEGFVRIYLTRDLAFYVQYDYTKGSGVTYVPEMQGRILALMTPGEVRDWLVKKWRE